MKTAIVILNWNGKQLLEQFLPSVVEFTPKEATIYIADNASTDTSIAFTEKFSPSVKIIKNTSNGGYAKGYNDALKDIEADIFCLLNSDVEVTENWLTPILEVFKNEEETGIIQPKILDFKDKMKFEYAGAGGGFIDLFGYPYCRGRIFNSLEIDKKQFNDIETIFWASGACLCIRSKIYNELKGFDEDYFAHQEEIDLCWRAQIIGFKVKYVGTSTVYHIGGATLQNSNPHKTFLNFRNSLFNLVKNTPKKWFFCVVFFRLILDGCAGIKFLIELKPIHTLAILRAHISFYQNFFKFLAKRKKVRPQYLEIQDYNRHVSIVWQYFILRRKKFKDLK